MESSLCFYLQKVPWTLEHILPQNRFAFIFLRLFCCMLSTLMQCAEDGCFPVLHSLRILSNPWLSDGCTMILPSIWGSSQLLISLNVLRWHDEYVSFILQFFLKFFSHKISFWHDCSITVERYYALALLNQTFAWSVVALDGDNSVAGKTKFWSLHRVYMSYWVEENKNEILRYFHIWSV